MPTFQEHAAENLSQFGWSIDAADIPQYDTCIEAMNEIASWWLDLDERTQRIISACDLAPGMKDEGLFDKWPAANDLLAGNVFGGYKHTHNNVLSCLERAKNQVGEGDQGNEQQADQ